MEQEVKKLYATIAIIILFFGVAMFFLGYRLAYVHAVNYANDKIIEFNQQKGRISYPHPTPLEGINLNFSVKEAENGKNQKN